ncbi:MAG: type I-C CRISPR-associated protein Cas8c/Csd1, partial [Candidatus Subteraquimicrobiales bacterium]|nr:type I-C CRISPR-associated protein Cas8c/Csd1 [Candidatus Subteraquimicrobiales bacterium]
MILQALSDFYIRKMMEGQDVEPEGFKRVAIPFIIIIRNDGSFVDIDDTRNTVGRKLVANSYFVPKIFEGSRTVNIKANLLWDKAGYVFGVSPDADPLRLPKQRKEFRKSIVNYFPEIQNYGEVSAVLAFLDNHVQEITLHKLWGEISTTDPNLAFRLEGKHELICSSDEVKQVLAKHVHSGDRGQCLVTGREDILVRLENPIKGLHGSGKAESHLVSFNESAYWSYAKEGKKSRHRNASIGKTASSAYVAAINYLQRKHFLKVGDATTVFWAEKNHEMENLFADFFGEPPKGLSEQDSAAIKALYKAPKTGAVPLIDDKTLFYVLGLAPNAARIAIRFWYQGSVGEVAEHIRQHFEDISIVHGPKEPEYLSLFRLLCNTATEGKADNIKPKLAGEVMRAILAGTPYPRTLMSAVSTRTMAEQSKRDPKTGKSIQNVNYSRAAIIKALLTRETRYRNSNTKEVSMSLDTSNTNPGYLLGRLFAVLERAQEQASPGINATIRDRFYGAASSTPVTVFAHLMKLKNH